MKVSMCRQVVRRIIDSDNSCLFNAVGYCLERSRTVASKLRVVVANSVASDPFTYNEGMLGKDHAEYQLWIKGADKWGGPIELHILSR
jgi:ubiquitin thioesterase OTU1